jgi:hypothetical protein
MMFVYNRTILLYQILPPDIQHQGVDLTRDASMARIDAHHSQSPQPKIDGQPTLPIAIPGNASTLHAAPGERRIPIVVNAQHDKLFRGDDEAIAGAGRIALRGDLAKRARSSLHPRSHFSNSCCILLSLTAILSSLFAVFPQKHDPVGLHFGAVVFVTLDFELERDVVALSFPRRCLVAVTVAPAWGGWPCHVDRPCAGEMADVSFDVDLRLAVGQVFGDLPGSDIGNGEVSVDIPFTILI